MDRKPEKHPHFSVGTWAAVLATFLLLLLTFLFYRAITERKTADPPDIVEELLSGREETMLPEAAEIPEETEEPAFMPETVPAAETAAPEEKNPQEMPSGFTLAVGGTVNVSRAIREFAREGSRYDFSTCFMGLGSRITDADLTLCTLETAADDQKPYDSVNAPSALLDALADEKIDFVSLGTEHMLDKGYDSLDVTLSELNLRSITGLGVRQEAGTLPGMVLTVGGIRTAILAYTYGLSDEGIAATKSDRRGTAPLLSNEKQVMQDIAKVRADGAEVVILLVHWGMKNRPDTPESVRALAERLAAAGADLIVGTHPSVVQSVEEIRAKRTDGLTRSTIVAYSLGNLLTDARTEESAAGMFLRCGFQKDQKTGVVSVSELSAVPIYVARQEEEGTDSWRVVEADNEASLSGLEAEERAAAQRAAALVKNAMSGVQTP